MDEQSLIPMGLETQYTVLSRSRPHLKQVMSIYVLAGLELGFIALYSNEMDSFPNVSSGATFIGGCVGVFLLALLPVLLRRRARGKLRLQSAFRD
jgi:hypothetical protein